MVAASVLGAVGVQASGAVQAAKTGSIREAAANSLVSSSWSGAGCSSDEGGELQSTGTQSELTQGFNGQISGCVRVPALGRAPLVVAFQTYVNRELPVLHWSLSSVASSMNPDGRFRLSLSSRDVRPGQVIIVRVHYLRPVPTSNQIDPQPTLCWDGCQTGVSEQIYSLRRVSASTFDIGFRVPETAWFEERSDGTDYVHPLTSGRYSVGIECIFVWSGCATYPADGQVTVHLHAPADPRCARGVTCSSLQLSSTSARVGDVIAVHGWAPVGQVIGRPFGMRLQVSAATRYQSYASATFTPVGKGLESTAILAPRRLTIRPSPTWADLGHLHILASSQSGVSNIQSELDSPLVAWCQSSSIEVTGGQAVQLIPVSGVPGALQGTNLKASSAARGELLECSSVMLDPRHRATVYAGFLEAPGGVAPPYDLAGVYTTDDGATWHTVPVPPGETYDDFGGFTLDGDGVVAIFTSPNDYDSLAAPVRISAEITDDGGESWSASTLGCPRQGPCVTFGPYEWNNCAMNPTAQSLLLNTTANAETSRVSWTTSSWVTSVNTCYSQQLVATSAQDLLLIDPGSQYPVLRSFDGGENWTDIALPAIKGNALAQYDNTDNNSLLLAPDGDLFAALDNPSNTKEGLYLLAPGSASWCEVPTVSGSLKLGLPGPLYESDSDLIWSVVTSNANGSRSTVREHVVPFSKLTC